MGRDIDAGGVLAGLSGAGLFLLVSVLVHVGLLSDLDLAAAGWQEASFGRAIDAWFPAVATMWSPELSLLYGLIAVLTLWRCGLGPWSAAPLAFVAAVPLEVILKLGVHRPSLPPVLKPWPGYPLVNPVLGESFLSGSAMRTGFLCVFLAVVLWKQGTAHGRAAAVASVALGLLVGFVRVGGGYHWLTNELGSQALGAGLAVLVAVPVAERLSTIRRAPRPGSGRPGPVTP